MLRLHRQQPNPATQKTVTDNWTRLILTYARHKKLFTLRVEDASDDKSEWDEVLRNPRIQRPFYLRLRSRPETLTLTEPVSLPYRPPPPVSSCRDPVVHGGREPGDVRASEPDLFGTSLLALAGGVGPGAVRLGPFLAAPYCFGAHGADGWLALPQANSTGHLNTIMTFYEIVEPPVPSPLEGLPLPILRKAIAVLTKSARAQIIAVADGEGVRFLPGPPGR